MLWKIWLKDVLDQALRSPGTGEKHIMDVDLIGNIFLLTNWQQSFGKQICICKHNLKLNSFLYYILNSSKPTENVFSEMSPLL